VALDPPEASGGIEQGRAAPPQHHAALAICIFNRAMLATFACLTRAMLPTLDAEERACTVTIAKHQDTFKKVDKNRWVYSESLPVSFVAASTQVLENDPQYSGLWTYTLNEIAAHPNPFPKDPLCAQFKGTNEVCSWKHPVAGLLNCEEVHLR
jgi:hypothetical protein